MVSKLHDLARHCARNYTRDLQCGPPLLPEFTDSDSVSRISPGLETLVESEVGLAVGLPKLVQRWVQK